MSARWLMMMPGDGMEKEKERRGIEIYGEASSAHVVASENSERY
jgi:hypothetical protein